MGDKQIAWFGHTWGSVSRRSSFEFERECRGWTFAAGTASCAVGVVDNPDLFGVRVMGAAANFERVTAKLVREVNSLNLHSPVKWLIDDDVVRAEMYLPAEAVSRTPWRWPSASSHHPQRSSVPFWPWRSRARLRTPASTHGIESD